MKRRDPINVLVCQVTMPLPPTSEGLHRLSWTRGPASIGPQVGGRVTTDPHIQLRNPSTQPDPDGG